MRHIEVLASDAFEGRAPATEGERRTIAYISDQLRRRGVEPAGESGGWYQPVTLIERRARSHQARWSSGDRALSFDGGRMFLVGTEAAHQVRSASAVFAGHGLAGQLAGADLRGAVAFVLVEGPDSPGFPSYAERERAVAQAGAAAVVGIVSDDMSWAMLAAAAFAGETVIDAGAPVTGAIMAAEFDRLVAQAGGEPDVLRRASRVAALGFEATLDVVTDVRRYASNNVVGRIRGTGSGRESVLLLGHWDHLGRCRPEGAEDRICNGAVDNASGIALLIEVAGRLARRRPERDVLILATTAEEVGLLGAQHFAVDPVVPLASIVAAINLDTIAIHGRDEPVAIVGRGHRALDQAIAETAAALGRRMDSSFAADSFVERQDGWALARAGVPAVMTGGSFANMDALDDFLSGAYHGPDDEASREMPLAGAAQDGDFILALVRRLADPARYRPPSR